MNKKNPLKTVFSYAKECREKMIFSVIFAVISAFAGLMPYVCAYKIIVLFFNESASVSSVLLWSAIALISHIIRLLFYGISTTLSHIILIPGGPYYFSNPFYGDCCSPYGFHYICKSV